MDSYSQEELNLYVETLEKVLPPDTRFFLVVCDGKRCSASLQGSTGGGQ
jgi:hypothetical protein